MDERTFLKHYKYDSRLITGEYYSREPLKIEAGDKVGVVLLNLGGPEKLEDIEQFLYNLFMDPAIIDMPFGGVLRHWLSSYIASKRSGKVAHDYKAIGGGSPITRLTKEQADTLESRLNAFYGSETNAEFKVYIAMRYWKPSTEEAVAQMRVDGVTKVVLLPLYPHYSKTSTGSSLVYWWLLEREKEIPAWPTTYVHEYATHPKFIQAISTRIDEAIARFPADVRRQIQLVFSPHGTPLYEMKKRRDPYCCLVHSTVEQVMRLRGNDLPFHVSFQSKVGPAEWLTPSTQNKLIELGQSGHKAVLVIPVAFVTDHIETEYELDIMLRDDVHKNGIEHYEVTKGLNSHPLFIETLADAVAAQLDFDSNTKPVLPTKQYQTADRTCRCHQCEHITEALCWQEAEVESV